MKDEEVIEKKEGKVLEVSEKEEKPEEKPSVEEELSELREKYLRLYAEFENYKKRVQKEKEELIKYGNEALLYELLNVLDNLEMALKHSSENVSEGLVKGVEMTLREFQRITEKFGLIPIVALGRPFDPSLHHAMSQVERDDVEDKTVVEEFRKGYMYGDKVLRASLVAVSKKSEPEVETSEINSQIKKEE
ncbi:MAG: nucleotide exchange factor GrpE [Thermodesulfovibrionales bacterium]